MIPAVTAASSDCFVSPSTLPMVAGASFASTIVALKVSTWSVRRSVTRTSPNAGLMRFATIVR